ncbi:MAG: ATP-binding cassette domain-containing protein [Clostridia bacterium]|nr:ATP-binding cassette domain-containing protein [Clostridia bacterium]
MSAKGNIDNKNNNIIKDENKSKIYLDNFADNVKEQTKHKRKLILKFSNVNKKIAFKNVIKDCNITLNKGEILAVLAPEGQGKSTLAKLAAGLIKPTEGDVVIRGVKAGRITNSIVSYQPDIPFFKYDYTVSDVLNMYGRFFKDFSYKRAYQLLKHFDISRRTKFENLSTTALFIVEVILTSSRRASLYIFDDPLVHCDPKYRDEIIKMIDPCRKNGAVLLFSQTANGLDDITDKVVFLRHGEIIKEFYDADSFEKEFGNSLLNDAYKEVFKRA